MRVVLYGGHPGGHEWYVLGPLDLTDGEREYQHQRAGAGLLSGSTGDAWIWRPTWIYVLTDETKTIDGEIVRVMRQDRVAPACACPIADPSKAPARR